MSLEWRPPLEARGRRPCRPVRLYISYRLPAVHWPLRTCDKDTAAGHSGLRTKALTALLYTHTYPFKARAHNTLRYMARPGQ